MHTLFRTALFVGIVVLLVGCSAPPDAPSTRMEGVLIYYTVSDLGGFTTGRTSRHITWCHVQIDEDLEGSDILVEVVAHEVGHCLDLFVLGFDHNGFDAGGCWVTDGECTPAEAYADAFAWAYLSKCGYNLRPLGWSWDGEPCYPPLARSVTPET